MTVEELYRESINRLKSADFIVNPALEARLLFCHELNLENNRFIMEKDRLEVDTKSQNSIDELVRARLEGKSIASLVGKKGFYDIEVYVNDNVLIPRPETELLIEQVLASLERDKSYRALDIGTGSGIIPLTLVKHFDSIFFEAIDKSKKALTVARKNAELLEVPTEKIKFFEADLFSFSPARPYDIIVSNPPYIPHKEVIELIESKAVADPLMALDGGVTGMDFYIKIKDFAEEHLKSGGMIFLEHGHSQKTEISELFRDSGYEISCYKDLAGLDRVVRLHKKV